MVRRQFVRLRFALTQLAELLEWSTLCAVGEMQAGHAERTPSLVATCETQIFIETPTGSL